MGPVERDVQASSPDALQPAGQRSRFARNAAESGGDSGILLGMHRLGLRLATLLGTFIVASMAELVAMRFGWEGRAGLKAAMFVIVAPLVACMFVPEIWDRMRNGPRPPGRRVRGRPIL